MAEIHDLVIPATEAPITAGVILRRLPDGIETNIPHRAIEHSPTGYEWGYGGSGPADLALNILEAALVELGHTGARQECWRGGCYRLAWALHQDYKFQVIAGLPHEGGVIPWDELHIWLVTRAEGNRLCLTCGEDLGAPWLTPDDYGFTERDGWTCPACGHWQLSE